MVIYIDNTIGEHADTIGFNTDEIALFSRLAMAHRFGKCLLCGDLHSTKRLAANLQGINSAIYTHISNKYSLIHSIVSIVETTLVLTYGDDSAYLPPFFEGKYRTIQIGDALSYNLDTQCSLVAENLDDCSFYELIGKRFMHDQNIKGVNLSFHYELGGGSTINTVYRKCVEQDKVLVLCLVDSDIKFGKTKKYPDPPKKGRTAIQLEETHEILKSSSTPVLFDLYCLPIHEVENLVPLAVLDSIANSTVPDMRNGIAFLRKLLDAKMEQSILYYDFKNGGRKIKDDPAVTYWIEVAETINDDTFPMLCGKTLEKAITVLSGDTGDSRNQITAVIIDDYLTPLWSEIGKKVFSWGCASQPIRA